MNRIDRFLNNITTYRLVLYSLICLLIIAFLEGSFRVLSVDLQWLLASVFFLIVTCWLTNKIFSKLFKAQTNLESVFISSLILACIVGPATSLKSFLFIAMAAIWTMASKYIFAIRRKHIFNPVAIGIWIAGLSLGQYATWWIGSLSMMPFVLIVGLLIVRKLRREYMFISFFISVFFIATLFSLSNPNDFLNDLKTAFFSTPIFFFAGIMFTEPLTTPPTKTLQIFYGFFVGILFTPQFHIGSFRTGIEGALLLGNIFSYLVSPRIKAYLQLQKKREVAQDTYDFIFSRPVNCLFSPGQYMEWTLAHKNVDSRGNRRYFTIASSPTEGELAIGVKIGPKRSSYKNALFNMNNEKIIIASQLAGDFILPKNLKEKLVFIAGGIGITPFRSMIKYLLDKKERRDIVLFYAAKNPKDFAYMEIFNKGIKDLGIRVIYTVTDKTLSRSSWKGHMGRIDAIMIAKEVVDHKERIFYLSGPNAMVKGYENILHELGVSGTKIKKDFFPGYA